MAGEETVLDSTESAAVHEVELRGCPPRHLVNHARHHLVRLGVTSSADARSSGQRIGRV
jgi:hypothetical protein